MRLGVNVDHVATLRNARDEKYPDPLDAAFQAINGGADNITCHLREDRRHIKDRDVERLREAITVPLNFEIAATAEMVAFAAQIKPHAVTLVPERRAEKTTERGLTANEKNSKLMAHCRTIVDSGILLSLFIDADHPSVDLAVEVGAKAVEFHTGHFCTNIGRLNTTAAQFEFAKPLIEAAKYAHSCGLQVHVGHGINYQNATWMQLVPHCEEANIGHAIVSQALFCGFEESVRRMKNLLCDPNLKPKSEL